MRARGRGQRPQQQQQPPRAGERPDPRGARAGSEAQVQHGAQHDRAARQSLEWKRKPTVGTGSFRAAEQVRATSEPVKAVLQHDPGGRRRQQRPLRSSYSAPRPTQCRSNKAWNDQAVCISAKCSNPGISASSTPTEIPPTPGQHGSGGADQQLQQCAPHTHLRGGQTGANIQHESQRDSS